MFAWQLPRTRPRTPARKDTKHFIVHDRRMHATVCCGSKVGFHDKLATAATARWRGLRKNVEITLGANMIGSGKGICLPPEATSLAPLGLAPLVLWFSPTSWHSHPPDSFHIHVMLSCRPFVMSCLQVLAPARPYQDNRKRVEIRNTIE